MAPFFSIIIPTYNRVNMLEAAIQSVLHQTDSDFELIIVDDHSDDNTAHFVTSLTDPRLKYILNDHHRGGAGARNAGIFRAKGEWVAFLDDDDLWLPEKLAVFREKIGRSKPCIGLLYSSLYICDSQNSEIKSIVTLKKTGWVSHDLLYQNIIGSFSCVVIRKDILFTVNGLDERFKSLQDLDLYVRVSEITQVDFIEQPLVYIRKGHPVRISTSMEKKLAGIRLFRSKYAEAIASNRKLRHRIDSQIFVAALHNKDWKTARQTTLWTCAGLGIDIKNMWWVAKDVVWACYRHTRQAYRSLIGVLK